MVRGQPWQAVYPHRPCGGRSHIAPKGMQGTPSWSPLALFDHNRSVSTRICIAGDAPRHDPIDSRQGAMVFLQTTTAGTARKFTRRMVPRWDRGSQRCIVRRTGPVGPHAVLASLAVWPDVGRSSWAMRYPDPRRRSYEVAPGK